MKCPSCGGTESKVVDSRTARDGESIRRRRECTDCGARFTTYEHLEQTQVLVIKKDGRREPFRRDKLDLGVSKACEKRPIPREAVVALIDRVEARVQAMGQSEVESRAVGELVMEELGRLDQIAYVRFASVYREFRDVNHFMEEIHRVLGQARREKGA
jgi:transcriptional repressor NrdR